MSKKKFKKNNNSNKKLRAGQNIIKIGSLKANELMCRCLEPDGEYYHLPVSTRHWEIGTSVGKYGKYCKIDETIFSVNSAGIAWVKVGSEKEERFLEAIRFLLREIEDADLKKEDRRLRRI